MEPTVNSQEQTDNRKVVIELQNVKRYFQVGSETVKALRGVSFQGTSGSGKSTLLNQLGCLDTPTSGEYFLDGISVRRANTSWTASPCAPCRRPSVPICATRR